MKVLLIAPYYPHADDPSRSPFTERFAQTLSELCERVDVLSPRPYAPFIISSLVPRWRAYRRIVRNELRNGLLVQRPAYLVIPRFASAFWNDPSAFLWCRRTARKMHRAVQFDGIISFDLGIGGAMAWRIGRDLGIPASGWAIGGDVNARGSLSHQRVVLRAALHLDLVFYQSRELLETVASRLGLHPRDMPQERHVVLPRGIPAAPSIARRELRERIRTDWGVAHDQIVVLSTGRIVRDKGVFEMLTAMSIVASRNPNVVCVLLGSKPAFDDTALVEKKLRNVPHLKGRVRLLRSCSPDRVWEFLCAADIFVFPSHREGMPNSLLEAMAMGIPAVTFAIPPVLEIEAGTGCLAMVPMMDSARLAEAILRLAGSPSERALIAERGKTRVLQGFMLRENTAEALRRLKLIVERRAVSGAHRPS